MTPSKSPVFPSYPKNTEDSANSRKSNTSVRNLKEFPEGIRDKFVVS